MIFRSKYKHEAAASAFEEKHFKDLLVSLTAHGDENMIIKVELLCSLTTGMNKENENVKSDKFKARAPEQNICARNDPERGEDEDFIKDQNN